MPYTYEALYRLPITSAIQSSHLLNRGSLQALFEWMELYNGRLEHMAATGAAPALAATIAAGKADDEWVQQAVLRVEHVISRVVTEFIADPLTHRAEHSLHARIWALLTAEHMFRGPVDIGRRENGLNGVTETGPKRFRSPTIIDGLQHDVTKNEDRHVLVGSCRAALVALRVNERRFPEPSRRLRQRARARPLSTLVRGACGMRQLVVYSPDDADRSLLGVLAEGVVP